MDTRTLGTGGLQVSALGFGCMGLQENLKAAEVHLAPGDQQEIENAVSHIEVHGARYPEHIQGMVGR